MSDDNSEAAIAPGHDGLQLGLLAPTFDKVQDIALPASQVDQPAGEGGH